MRIIILDTLINQANDRRIPADVIRRLYDEFYVLSNLERRGPCAIIPYLQKNADGIKMKGALGKGEIPIFKFRISGGDRILYTYGEYLPYISNEDKSIVLLEFSSHDSQARIAKKRDYTVEHKYDYIQQIVKSIKILDDELNSEEDLRQTVGILLAENFKGYAYTDEELKEFSVEDIDKHVILSEEQNLIMQQIMCSINSQIKRKASLIVGGAGTGKTLISVRLLEAFNNSNENSDAMYFTQSKELLKKVEKQYSSIATKNTTNFIEFFNINDFCIDQLGLDYSCLVTTNDFLLFLNSNNDYAKKIRDLRSKHPQIEDVMIWTEIRGILKGSMGIGNAWEHISSLNQRNFSSCIKYLFEENYIKRIDNNGNFRICDSIDAIKKRLASDFEYNTSKQLREATNKIIEHFSKFDHELRIMPEEQYLSMSDEISVLPIEQRSLVYKIALIYDEYLIEENLFDENDLVREMFACNPDTFPKYEFVVVDEVQDYTELQIYLTHKICSNDCCIVYAGDVHQIINPTVFDIARLKSLYFDENNKSLLDIYFLQKNFRCQQGVVNVANKISDIRRNAVGRKAAEVEREETSAVSTVYSHPYRLLWNKNNFYLLIKELIKYPDVVILVPTEIEKNYLLSLITKYSIDSVELELLKIYTISEIKGTEFAYVVCFNMINTFSSTISGFFSENKILKAKQTKNRFCFNSIYVATTRAQHHLCFVDENVVKDFDEALSIDVVDTFKAENLYFNTLSDSLEAWYEEGKKLKESGKYADAIKYFIRSGDYAKRTDIYECKAEISVMNKEYSNAVTYFILQGDFASAQKYINEKGVSADAKKILSYLTSKKLNDKSSEMVKRFCKKMSKEDKERILQLTLNKASEILIEKTNSFTIPEVNNE